MMAKCISSQWKWIAVAYSIWFAMSAGVLTWPPNARADEGRRTDGEVLEKPAADHDARAAILISPAWRETMHALDEWLSAQPIYSAEAVARYRAELQRRLASMSADELEEFARDLGEKLSLVSSTEWEETIGWIEETVSVATPAYARTLNLKYPDVLGLTSAQLQGQLKALERRHDAARREAQAFERLRGERFALRQQALREQAAARERALDRAAMSTRFASYQPAHTATQRTRRPFYPPLSPYAFAFGLGFGFW
jgi:hypothetical protein